MFSIDASISQYRYLSVDISVSISQCRYLSVDISISIFDVTFKAHI